MKEILKITQKQVQASGVQALSDRPNKPSRYGQGGLSATELKLWFDKLSQLLVNNHNLISDVFASPDATDYIALNPDFQLTETSLKDLLSGIVTGKFAQELIVHISNYPYPSTPPFYPNLEAALTKVFDKIAENSEANQNDFDRVWAELAATMNAVKGYEISTGTDDYGKPYIQFYLQNKAGETINSYKLYTDITNEDFADGTLTGRTLADGTIPKRAMGNNSVGAEQLEDGSVTNGKIGAKAVSNDKMADGSVGTDNIVANAVTQAKLSSALSALIDQLNGGAFVSVSYNSTNGVLTFTSPNGHTANVDLPLELLVSGGRYDNTPGSEAIILVLANGEEIRIPIGDLIAGITDDLNDLISKIRNEVKCQTLPDAEYKDIYWNQKPLVEGDIILAQFVYANNNTSPTIRVFQSDGNTPPNYTTVDYTLYANGGRPGESDTRLKMPPNYVAYLRVETGRMMMLNPITGGSNIDDNGTFLGKTWSSQKTSEEIGNAKTELATSIEALNAELAKPVHNTLYVDVVTEGIGGYRASLKASEIGAYAVQGGGFVKLRYEDAVSGEDRIYDFKKYDRVNKIAYFARSNNTASSIDYYNIKVKEDRSVEVEEILHPVNELGLSVVDGLLNITYEEVI